MTFNEALNRCHTPYQWVYEHRPTIFEAGSSDDNESHWRYIIYEDNQRAIAQLKKFVDGFPIPVQHYRRQDNGMVWCSEETYVELKTRLTHGQ